VKTIVAATATAVVLVACGVPVQEHPEQVDPAAIPSQLRSPSTPASEAPSATPGKPTVRVSFVREDRLVELVREATPSASTTDRLNTVIQALLAGPADTEQAAGITSALPPGLTLSVIEVRGQLVVLDLAGDTQGRSTTENILALGQIVLSVTAVPTIDEVSFSRNGQPVEALLADGALTTDPLTAADYAGLRSR
jgi:spore germination protein GerM